jgi:hypothetical protein
MFIAPSPQDYSQPLEKLMTYASFSEFNAHKGLDYSEFPQSRALCPSFLYL